MAKYELPSDINTETTRNIVLLHIANELAKLNQNLNKGILVKR